MKYKLLPSLDKRDLEDVLIVPFWEGEVDGSSLGPLKSHLDSVFLSGDFKGKGDQTLLVYSPEGRILLLGLGKEESATSETLRRSYSHAVHILQRLKVKSCHLIAPKGKKLPSEEVLKGVWEGLLLSNYAFNQLKGDTLKEAPPLLEKVSWIGLSKKDEPLLDHIQAVAEGIYLARDLVNGNADEVTPAMLAETARSFEKRSSKLKTTIFDKKWLEKEKMGLILAVSRGSKLDPYLIQIAYKGNPSSKEHIVLVGKGVTYDTGGLALKTAEGMTSMKCDMAGGAAILATMRTIADLNLKVNVTALVPTVENAIDARSYKNGDVYRSYSGKTVEVNNTDAEGRLILADALAYAEKNLRPTYMVDLATLTGNVILALGEHVAGFCANDDKLSEQLMEASAKSSDFLWRLPLWKEYKEAFKSDIADLLNSGGRDAGSIKGAIFLHEFVGKTKWAHIDIAGTAFWSKGRHYNPTKATGYGVRLLVEFLSK